MIDGHRETWPVAVRAFFVLVRLGNITKPRVAARALERFTASALIAGSRATVRRAPTDVYIRVAEHDGRSYLDMG